MRHLLLRVLALPVLALALSVGAAADEAGTAVDERRHVVMAAAAFVNKGRTKLALRANNRGVIATLPVLASPYLAAMQSASAFLKASGAASFFSGRPGWMAPVESARR